MRCDLTEKAWTVIEELLPPERGRGCRPAQDTHRFPNGMLYVLRVDRSTIRYQSIRPDDVDLRAAVKAWLLYQAHLCQAYG